MIEELNKSIQKRIEQEVFKQTADIRGSPFQDPSEMATSHDKYREI